MFTYCSNNTVNFKDPSDYFVEVLMPIAWSLLEITRAAVGVAVGCLIVDVITDNRAEAGNAGAKPKPTPNDIPESEVIR